MVGRSGSCFINSFLNTLRPKQNGRRFADDTFKRIFLNENVTISIKTSLRFVPKGPINNNPALFQIMAWRRPGDKPLFEPMMVNLVTHVCVTRPQWVKTVGLWDNFLPRGGKSSWNSSLSVDDWILQWRLNERDGVSSHRPRDYVLNHLFRRRWKKTS